MKQKNNDWNVPESYFLENKSRLLHHTEWEVEEIYFERNKAELLKPYDNRFIPSWVYVAAAACVLGIGLFFGLKESSQTLATAAPLATLPTTSDTTPTPVSIQPIESDPTKNTSKSTQTHTNQPVKQHVETESNSVPADFEQALASISKEDIINYLAEQEDDSWYDTNTN